MWTLVGCIYLKETTLPRSDETFFGWPSLTFVHPGYLFGDPPPFPERGPEPDPPCPDATVALRGPPGGPIVAACAETTKEGGTRGMMYRLAPGGRHEVEIALASRFRLVPDPEPGWSEDPGYDLAAAELRGGAVYDLGCERWGRDDVFRSIAVLTDRVLVVSGTPAPPDSPCRR